MTRAYKILRALMMMMIALAIIIPMLLYIGLSLPSFQKQIVKVAQRELTRQLGVHVSIGSLSIAPFNRLMLRDVTITSKGNADTLMTVDRLGAGINMQELITNRHVVINYAELVGLNGKLTRDSIAAPLNIQPLIDRFKPRDNQPKIDFSMAINTVLMRNCRLSYDVKDQPRPQPGQFSPNHVHITDLSTDLLMPSVGNNGGKITVKRLRFKERSGMELSGLSGSVTWSPGDINWTDIDISMPRTNILSSGNIKGRDSLNIAISHGSFITPSDLAPFIPLLAKFTEPINLTTHISGSVSDESLIALTAMTPTRSLDMHMSASIVSPRDTVNRAINNLNINADINTTLLTPLFSDASRQIQTIAANMGTVGVNVTGNADAKSVKLSAAIKGTQGNIKLTGEMRNPGSDSPQLVADVSIEDLKLGHILQNRHLNSLSMKVSSRGKLYHHRYPDGRMDMNLECLDWNGHPLGNIKTTVETRNNRINLAIDSRDAAALFSLNASGNLLSRNKDLSITSRFEYIDLGELLPEEKYKGLVARLLLDATLDGTSVDDINGSISITNIELTGQPGREISIDGIRLNSTTGDNGYRTVTLESDILTGSVSGTITPSVIGHQLTRLLVTSVPALLPQPTIKSGSRQPDATEPFNDFAYKFTLHETERWADALKLPVSILGDGDIHGSVNTENGNLSLVMDLPYLRQGNKLIEKTRLQATISGNDSVSAITFGTHFPTKHGPLSLDFSSRGSDNEIISSLNWVIDRAARYDGHLSATTQLQRIPSGLFTSVTLNPGNLTFNDSTWTINRAVIDIDPDYVSVNGLNAYRSGQFVKIDGRASRDIQDVITIDLLNVNLDYIFESLGIDKVMLGGDATGCFYASNLFSQEPHLLTDRLTVKSISYNKVVLGDAVIKSQWDTERRAITLDAVIEQGNDIPTLIDGAIFPLNDSIDITFDAHDVDVAFMHPYMAAFASEVTGRASGVARLWGNFKYIDMEGDIVGDNVGIKVAFTNTAYTTSDTIRLRLGEITLHNLEIKDTYGNRSILDGKVWHKYFKEPVFDFTVKDVHNMLVYDENSRLNPDWYGRIFADGSAHIDGRPGVVNIGVDMSTAPGSTFTFVLNDMEEASDYSFITFRNRDITDIGENEKFIDDTPSAVKRLRELLDQRVEDSSSAYNIELVMDINPNTRIDLVMDPVGGDRIRSWGNGNLRMTYGSSDNELHMYGSYTLDKGNYNFTLQDIIIKDFSIKPGSSISFTGDPFSAMLDIKAIYSLNANLSDLDESFLQDRDLNRTNVPVHAVLQVSGPLNQPDIGFDLEFPTLTQDTYRKVRSIVSTDDMMNRQIIYLLALNRFYTPDYMAANRSSELASVASVASSTISSQLGNILGSLSDKWNIAPTFRSDRGDFSDVEVDVALSSSLLNNRLLFNGNFGYRDKSLNSTQFVGDFDIEYLLNRTGTLRLKAYNRYNDQNYYVRTADTTQGVGISFRRNFDTFSDLLKSFHRKRKVSETGHTDSLLLQRSGDNEAPDSILDNK